MRELDAMRQALCESYIDAMGPKPSWARPHRRIAWQSRKWAVRKAIGDGNLVSPRLALFRCSSCGSLLTTAGMVKNHMSCGHCNGSTYSDRIGNAGFWAILFALLNNR